MAGGRAVFLSEGDDGCGSGGVRVAAEYVR